MKVYNQDYDHPSDLIQQWTTRNCKKSSIHQLLAGPQRAKALSGFIAA